MQVTNGFIVAAQQQVTEELIHLVFGLKENPKPLMTQEQCNITIQEKLQQYAAKKNFAVKEEGRMYVRNICMAFDLRLIENEPNTRVFSMTI